MSFEKLNRTVVTDKKITRLGFINRFTDAEAISIDIASIDDPLAEPSTRQQQAAVRRYLAKVSAAAYIDLSRADTQDAINTLVFFGFITQQRASEILYSPINDMDKYKE